MDKQTLINKAIEAMNSAYAPYSNFKVGAALLSEDGEIHIGCNVENAAYGPTNCAERTAMFRAIADGYKPKSFKAIAVAGDTENPISPCGVCRQVLVELCSEQMPVILVNLKGDQTETTVAELLPGAFHL
ncbi:cytidine deaminase [Chengkuizengella axinellae]|uniref:Cytidine deaminase n=1 Tax=Chengkuizengella axinellae TaxID=3064388 RepID=A0ABT9IUR2_9BACL|nr:cytidine deaminase [Chengkuizengella sp. 2205SS18-9]MDP5273099.1 cytidine deaminase [Chengkuizengella sp. 2205SS18-9]